MCGLGVEQGDLGSAPRSQNCRSCLQKAISYPVLGNQSRRWELLEGHATPENKVKPQNNSACPKKYLNHRPKGKNPYH